MKYKYSSDTHSHSSCSPDGKDSIEKMAEAAAEMGLHYYAVTDHCECNDYDGKLVGHDYSKWSPESYDILKENAERLHSKLNLLTGIELGQPMQNIAAAEEIVGGREYDFVLGSVHNIKDYEDFYYLKYEDMEEGYVDGLLTMYFGEMLQMVKWGKIDSLAHLTYPLRYKLDKDGNCNVDLKPHYHEMQEVFKEIIKRDIAIEINTARLLQPGGRFFPDIDIVRLYKETGGKLITVGSDAHRAKHIGVGIDAGLDMMKEAGYKEFTVYVNRVPQLLPII